MNNIIVFEFKNKNIRTIEHKGSSWFVAKDVCNVLGYSNNRKATSKLDSVEKDDVTFRDAIGRKQEMKVINESGLYSLILRSRLKRAKAFKNWVTSEVLPSIRKTGSFNLNVRDPKQLANIAIQLLDVNKELHQKLDEQKPKVEFYNRFKNSKGLLNLRQTAKELGLQPKHFITLLEGVYLYRANVRNEYGMIISRYLVPRERYISSQLFSVLPWSKNGMSGMQTMVTSKGIAYLAQKLKM